MRQTILALSAAALLAGVAGTPLPAAAQEAASRASCTAGPISDGTYTTAERERRKNADKEANADKPRKAGRDAVSAEGTGITEVTLTWQCGGTGPDGAFIPTGYKLQMRGECPSGTCDLGTTIAMAAKREGQFSAVLADETVGYRQIHLDSKRRSVSMSVRTEVDGEKRPAMARYVLERKG